jgi:hypothetical protein
VRTVTWTFVVAAVVGLLLFWLLRLDVGLFLFRGLVGAASVPEKDAAATVLAFDALPADAHQLAAMRLHDILGWGYLAAALMAPVLLEVMGAGIRNTWAILQEIVAGGGAVAADDETQTLYGFDAEGQPVFDPETPIAFDADQHPVTPSPGLEQANAAANEPDAAPAASASTEAGARPRPAADGPARAESRTSGRQYEVIGGKPGERVTLAEARTRPRDFHVAAGSPPVIYARAYWDAIHGNPKKEKEAA